MENCYAREHVYAIVKEDSDRIDKVCFQHEVDEPYVAPILSITPLEVALVASTYAHLDDEVDAHSLISSLRKLFEKNKFVKSLEKTLNSILDRMAKTMPPIIAKFDIQ